MIRISSALMLAATLTLTVVNAQEIVPVNHGPQSNAAKATVVDGGSCASCATGNCGTCNDCLRITEIKKTQHPVYACKVKEICVPNCSLFGHLFGCSGGCTKIEVRQLVKKYRTDEECVSKCVTAEEAAKHYESEAKKAAERAKTQQPAPAVPPTKLPNSSYSNFESPISPSTVGFTRRSIPGEFVVLPKE